jgi:hypothetical protein
MKKTILSFTAMCCISINPGESYNREENKAWKLISVRTAQEAAQLELALASIIREEDIEELTGSLNQKLLEQSAWITDRSTPGAPLLLLTHDFWQFILTGVDKDQAFGVSKLSLPPDKLACWLDLFSTTIEEHFSGTMGYVARDKVVRYIDSFLYRLLLLPR